tara:strand:+ start:727 stop:1044 length:318 start_codon:yes stop_codon:yes gene_type:complete
MLNSNKNSSFSLDWIGHIPSSIAIIDTNFKLISASPKWQLYFQIKLNQLEGKDFIELFSELAQEIKARLEYSFISNYQTEVMNEKITEARTPNQGSTFKNYFNKV